MGMMGMKDVLLTLQRIGNIKMGFKGEPRQKKGKAKGDTYRLPQKLEYFLVTTMDRDEKTDDWIVDEEIMDLLGEKPKTIPVYVPYHTIELIFPREYAWWSGSRRHCQGNGQVALRIENEGDEPVQMGCPCDKLNVVCKPHGILNVILEASGRIGGVYQLRTTSHNTIKNIVASLNLLKQLTNGPLAGVPLTLTIQSQKAHPKAKPGQKAPGQVTIYVAGLEFRSNPALPERPIQQLQMAAHGIVQAQLAMGQDMKMIEEAASNMDIDTIMDATDWEEEFVQTEEENIVDVKTDGKVETLKKRLETAKEKASVPAEVKEKPKAETVKQKAKAKPVTQKAKAKPKTEPAEAEIEQNLRTELTQLLDGIQSIMPKDEWAKWDKWMGGNPLIEHLKQGKTSLGKIIIKLEDAAQSDEPVDPKKGSPSLKGLTDQLIELVVAGLEEGLVTQEEVDAVNKDVLVNQNTKWLTIRVEEWTAAMNDRREIRAAESDVPGEEPGQQSLV